MRSLLATAHKELEARMFKAYAPDSLGKELSFGLGWFVGERELGSTRRTTTPAGCSND